MSFCNFFCLFNKFRNHLLQGVFLVSFKKWFFIENRINTICVRSFMLIVSLFATSILAGPPPTRAKLDSDKNTLLGNTGSNLLVASQRPEGISDSDWGVLESVDSWQDIAYKLESGLGNCTDYKKTTTQSIGTITSISEDLTKMEQCEKVMRILKIKPQKEGDKSGCEAAKEKFDEAKEEANTKCSQLKSGNMGACFAIMRSCQDCPEEGGKKCAKLPSGAKCPQLAGNDLEELKEEIEDGKTALEDLESDIKDLQDQILEKKGELAEAKKNHDEDLNTLQNELQETHDELETAVKENQVSIDESLQKAIDTVQAEISKSLKLQHAFSNEIAKAERTRREAKQKLYEKCRHTAAGRLAAYRQYRRRAIREGRYGNKGVRKMMGKVRVSFTKQDNIRYQGYYSGCISESAPLFNSIEEDYQTTMTLIEQQKEQMIAQYQSLQAQAQQLNNKALQKKNKDVQNFAEDTLKALHRHDTDKNQRIKQYRSESQQLNMALMTLKEQLQGKQGQLDAVNSRQGFNSRLKHSLKKKGVSSGDSSQEETNVAEAQSALENFRDTVEPVYDECCAGIELTLSSREKDDIKSYKKARQAEMKKKMLKDKWENAKNKDCTSFKSTFKSIYSTVRFEDYTHEVNRDKMRRKMDMRHGSH